MPPSPLARLLGSLPVTDPGRVARCRREATARTIEYPYGSGQAEELALYAGLRPLIRQRLRGADVETTLARAVRRRLHARVAPGLYRQGRAGTDRRLERGAAPAEDAYRIVIVGRDPRDVDRAVDCEDGNADRELGRLLGYPRCCVEAYVSAPLPRRNVDVLRAASARTPGRFDPRLNMADMGVFHYVSWAPCSFACELSARYAHRVASLLDRHALRFRVQIDGALHAHRLMLGDDVQLSLRGQFDGARLLVEYAWPTVCDRHPGPPLDEDVREAIGRLLALVRGAREISVRGRSLQLDGLRLDVPVEPLLLPFGT